MLDAIILINAMKDMKVKLQHMTEIYKNHEVCSKCRSFDFVEKKEEEKRQLEEEVRQLS